MAMGHLTLFLLLCFLYIPIKALFILVKALFILGSPSDERCCGLYERVEQGDDALDGCAVGLALGFDGG
jgi:hypothetical protein